MNDFMAMLRSLPLPLRVMLACATARAFSFFALLAYLPIYLHTSLEMSEEQIGFAIGVSLLIGTLTGVYGGHLADRFAKVDIIIALDLALTALYATLPAWDSPVMVVGYLLVINIASSSMSVAANALIAELAPDESRAKVFSLRYSLQNIGAAIGPFLGAMIALSFRSGPFLLAGGIILLALLPIIVMRRRFLSPAADAIPFDESDDEKLSFAAALRILRGDRRLSYFTIGGILSIILYGPLLTYMGQYLIVVQSREAAYQTVAYISATNAVVVVAAQYVIGSRLREQVLLRWLFWGIGAFIVGLAGFALSQNTVVIVVAVAIFTLGEVIVVPAEYMFVDMIAPNTMRGSYFGAQNLVHVGIALGPAICGFLLERFQPVVMFGTLIVIALLSVWFYLLGCRAADLARATQLGTT
jgi:MFS family permease